MRNAEYMCGGPVLGLFLALFFHGVFLLWVLLLIVMSLYLFIEQPQSPALMRATLVMSKRMEFGLEPVATRKAPERRRRILRMGERLELARCGLRD